MSLLVPEMPSRPDCRKRIFSTSAAERPSVWNRYRITPGSRAPGRVLMHNPSSAVKPRVQSILLPPCSAQRLAPLPRCATITRFAAMSGVAAMKARVEARDLRHGRQALADRLDRRQIVRLMQRGERRQCAQFLEDLR